MHSIFAKVLKRLLFKRFNECDNMPDRVRILLENESDDEFEIKRLLEDDEVRNMMIRYNRFKERISHGLETMVKQLSSVCCTTWI